MTSIRIPYGRQTIDAADERAVLEALRSDWLTQGPRIAEFEKALASYCGAKRAVAVANGTAALQAAYAALDLGPGDEIITSPLTFSATAMAAIWQGAKPVFADVDEHGNLDPQAARRAITARTRAIVPVDFAGRPAELKAFRAIAREKNLALVEDACHALGAELDGKKIGSWSDLTAFSFHPVKSITTGEGGAIITDDEKLAARMERFRMHGIERQEDWEYAVEEQGVNFRITDLQAALGTSQLKKLDGFVAKRRAIARRYNEAFAGHEALETPPGPVEGSAWHLYVLRLRGAAAGLRRDVFRALRSAGIGVQVHYSPVYYHPFYARLGYQRGLCPRAEALYERILSLPIYPTLTEAQQAEVVDSVEAALKQAYAHRAAR